MADDPKPATPSERIGSFVSRLLGFGTPDQAPASPPPVAVPAPPRSEASPDRPDVDRRGTGRVADSPIADLPLEAPADPALPMEVFDPELSPESFESIPTPQPLAFQPLAPQPHAPPPAPEPLPLDRPAPPAPVPEPAAIAADLAAPGLPPSSLAPNWWGRLRQGLSRSSSALGTGITDLFARRKLDPATLEELEDVLIQADLGVDVATRIVDAVRRGRYERGIEPEAVRGILADEVEAVLTPVAKPFAVDRARTPFVVLMVGVNGSGKTTTIGKLAQKFVRDGLSVTLAAGDTFRAAAIEQLKVWGTRTGSPVIARQQGGDAAGLAFDAVQAAQANGSDVLLIDTAGRLQNKTQLMDELAKVVRVVRKVEPSAPHAVLLVLDATVGQNALAQVELFGRTAGVTGLVMTKLDGTARGGILVAIADRFALPVHYIGVGEGVEDLEPFSARSFARAIAGFDTEERA